MYVDEEKTTLASLHTEYRCTSVSFLAPDRDLTLQITRSTERIDPHAFSKARQNYNELPAILPEMNRLELDITAINGEEIHLYTKGGHLLVINEFSQLPGFDTYRLLVAPAKEEEAHTVLSWPQLSEDLLSEDEEIEMVIEATTSTGTVELTYITEIGSSYTSILENLYRFRLNQNLLETIPYEKLIVTC